MRVFSWNSPSVAYWKGCPWNFDGCSTARDAVERAWGELGLDSPSAAELRNSVSATASGGVVYESDIESLAQIELELSSSVQNETLAMESPLLSQARLRLLSKLKKLKIAEVIQDEGDGDEEQNLLLSDAENTQRRSTFFLLYVLNDGGILFGGAPSEEDVSPSPDGKTPLDIFYRKVHNGLGMVLSASHLPAVMENPQKIVYSSNNTSYAATDDGSYCGGYYLFPRQNFFALRDTLYTADSQARKYANNKAVVHLSK